MAAHTKQHADSHSSSSHSSSTSHGVAAARLWWEGGKADFAFSRPLRSLVTRAGAAGKARCC